MTKSSISRSKKSRGEDPIKISHTSNYWVLEHVFLLCLVTCSFFSFSVGLSTEETEEERGPTVDGRNSAPVDMAQISYYLHGFKNIPGGFSRRISEPSTTYENPRLDPESPSNPRINSG